MENILPYLYISKIESQAANNKNNKISTKTSISHNNLLSIIAY